MRYTQDRPAYSQFWLCTGRSTLKKIFLSCYVDSSRFGGCRPQPHRPLHPNMYNVYVFFGGLPPPNPPPKAEKRDTCRIHLATQWTAPLVAGTSRTVGVVTQAVTTDHNTDHKPNTDPKRHVKPALTLKWRKCWEKKNRKDGFLSALVTKQLQFSDDDADDNNLFDYRLVWLMLLITSYKIIHRLESPKCRKKPKIGFMKSWGVSCTLPRKTYPLGGSTTRTPKWYRKKID